MPSEEELIAERKRKREDLFAANVNPYPYTFDKSHTSSHLQEKYKNLANESQTKDNVKIAGRIISLRRMGKATFAHLLDEQGKIQAYFKFDDLKNYDHIKLIDMGDWLGVEGTIFKTKTGEVTVWAKKFEILCKALRPLPEKWHGLTDIEQRYRKRYVDLIMNPDIRDVFKNRAKKGSTFREELDKRGFLEADTPIIQTIYGGASAKPFNTHINTLKMDVYLRIATELHLKRLLVGGLEKVYEIGKLFRNEDADRTHNPEFTSIEIYQAHTDLDGMKELIMDLYIAAAKAIHGSTKFEFQGNIIDVKKPWSSYSMAESLKKFANIDAENISEKELSRLCAQHKAKLEKDASKGMMIQALFEEIVEKKLIQPTFITHHPIESTPLAKQCREPHLHENFVERFEPFICGMEVGNAYSELNDPIVQRNLLEDQAKQLRAGSEEAHPMDEDFVQAIEYGMPL